MMKKFMILITVTLIFSLTTLVQAGIKVVISPIQIPRIDT